MRVEEEAHSCGGEIATAGDPRGAVDYARAHPPEIDGPLAEYARDPMSWDVSTHHDDGCPGIDGCTCETIKLFYRFIPPAHCEVTFDGLPFFTKENRGG